MGLPTDTAFVGIDVSKDALDACLLLPTGKHRQAAFAHDAGGFAALLAWADRHAGGLPLPFCLEATGPSSDAPPPPWLRPGGGSAWPTPPGSRPTPLPAARPTRLTRP